MDVFRAAMAEGGEGKPLVLPSPYCVDFQMSKKYKNLLPSLAFARNRLIIIGLNRFAKAKRQK
ncbi:hypothetical protein EII14_01555 [Alloprevotella sp. OH1205_COT-284]|uniref:hypothetical protein n=1 Tax=Alloprevotella sp. OH1205_COT-284 TaxID=2491043 RepID=UPI000F5FA49B|nr:hypothetical protein [Alloprevotella sp. OH1205_COT-284]RRD80507.1 hypothetical protein EII14_01555 [Alloprevotella sp. OH1205_COT-284]